MVVMDRQGWWARLAVRLTPESWKLLGQTVNPTVVYRGRLVPALPADENQLVRLCRKTLASHHVLAVAVLQRER